MEIRKTDYTFEKVIRPSKGRLQIDFKGLWDYRELLFKLILREVQGKYRQSKLGFLWAIIPPILQMFIFTIIFGKVARLGPENIPYPIFSYAALLPWLYFTRALSGAATSVVGKGVLINKVYFPRLILPLTGVFAALVDLVMASTIMGGIMIWYRVIPGWGIIMVPAFILLAMITALGVGMWLTALHVKYRDVGFVTPFLIQMWMYVTPVIYSIDKIPEKYQIFMWLNPMTGVIEGFRWALLGQASPNWSMMGLSLGIIFILLVSGAFYFKSMEKTFVDII